MKVDNIWIQENSDNLKKFAETGWQDVFYRNRYLKNVEYFFESIKGEEHGDYMMISKDDYKKLCSIKEPSKRIYKLINDSDLLTLCVVGALINIGEEVATPYSSTSIEDIVNDYSKEINKKFISDRLKIIEFNVLLNLLTRGLFICGIINQCDLERYKEYAMY